MIQVKEIPSDKEINELETKLNQMKEAKSQAVRQLASALKSDEFVKSLRADEVLGLMNKLQARIRGNHRRRRGSPVPEELKDALIKEIIRSSKTLEEMSDALGLSVSYISKVKRHLKDSGVLSENAYTDRPLKHHQAEIHELQPA